MHRFAPHYLAVMDHAQLAEWFRPTVCLHPKENYWPCSFDDYLAHCTLKRRSTGEVVEEKVTPDILAKYNKDPEDRALCLDCAPAFWAQRPIDVNDVPLYVKVDDSDSELYWIQYWMFYSYNGALDIGCFSRAQCCPSNKAIIEAGAHQADFEHISVYVYKKTMRIAKLYYSAHGDADGQWFNEDQITLTNSRHPVVYSAYHSHAHYAKAGCVPRIFGCANDFAEDDGPVWESNNLQLLERGDPVWQVYVGGLGFPDSGEVPANKESWTTEPNLSATRWSRLFRYLNLSCCCQPIVEDDAPPVPRISPIFSSSSSSSVR